MSSIPAAELLFDILIVLHNDVYGTYHITSMFLSSRLLISTHILRISCMSSAVRENVCIAVGT